MNITSSWNEKAICLPGALLAIILSSSTAVHAQEFGTLFTSPEEREYLDYLRQDFVTKSQLATFNIAQDVIPDIPVVEAASQTDAEVVDYKFGGVMTRINGNRMVWLNDKQVSEAGLPENLSLVNSASGIQLRIRFENQIHLIKPGERIHLSSNNAEIASSSEDIQETVPEISSDDLASASTELEIEETLEAGAENEPAPPSPPVNN